MKEHIVLITFDIPITNKLMEKMVVSYDWLRVSNKEVLILRNTWLALRSKLQPHTAKDMEWN